MPRSILPRKKGLLAHGQCGEISLRAQRGENLQLVGERFGGESVQNELRNPLEGLELRRHVGIVPELPGTQHFTEEHFPREGIFCREIEPCRFLVIAGIEKQLKVIVDFGAKMQGICRRAKKDIKRHGGRFWSKLDEWNAMRAAI